MEILNIILAVLLIGMSIALIVFVLFQTGGRSNRLSQAISGGSPENYTGKNKQRSKDKQLARVTTILAIIFAVIVIVFTLVVQYQLNKADQPEDTSAVTTADTAEATGTETEGEATGADTTTEAVTETEPETTTEPEDTNETT